MANTKEYKIVINGITESIDAVKSLEKELSNLEQRIKELESRTVNVRTTGTGGGGTARANNVAALTEEEAAQREINKLKAEGERLDAKIVAAQNEIYKRVDATKQLYKETIADQKALAAQERLDANRYNINTMQGMKERLADLKAVINTTDLGDTDKLKQMTEEANKLNASLLEVEKSYGQFGRQVGNYPDAAKSLQSIVVTIGGVEREFGSAREATKTLNNELKAMAVNGKENTKEYEELRQKLLELESTMNDAKKPMDNLMDTMESITAIASVSKGLGAFFGVDNTEIQRSIQQLLALQTALKGLQSIAKQVETREGVGKWIAPFTTSIDKATAKLLVFNRALLGTSKAGKTAAVGINVLSKALKVAFSAGILLVVDLLIEGLTALASKITGLSDEEKRLNETSQAMAETYGKTVGELTVLQSKLDSFNGSKKEEKRLVEELNSKYGDGLGQYKTLAEWKEVLKKKTDVYCKSLLYEAQIQSKLNQLVAAYQKLDDIKNKKGFSALWNDVFGTSVEAQQNVIDSLEESLKDLAKQKDKLDAENDLFDYSPQIEKNGKKTKNAVQEIEKEIAQARIAGMKEGLNKTITQLEEERKQRLAKLDKNMKNYKSYELQINNIYNQRILDATKNWEDKMKKTYADMWKSINQDTLSNLKDQYEIIKKGYEQYTNGNKLYGGFGNNAEYSRKNVIPSYGIQAAGGLRGDTKQLLGLNATFDETQFGEDMRKFVDLQRQVEVAMEEEYLKYSEFLEKMNEASGERTDAELGRLNLELDGIIKHGEKIQKEYDIFKNYIFSTYDEIDVKRRQDLLYEEAYSDKLSTLFKQRNTNIENEQRELDNILELELEEATKKRKEIADKAYEIEYEEAKDHWNKISSAASDTYTEELSGLQAQLKKGLISRKQYNKLQDEAIAQYNIRMKEILDNWHTTEKNLEEKHNQELNQIKQDALNKRQEANAKYYNKQLQELRDFQTAIVNIESKQPVQNAWGITNFTETNKNNRNILDSYKTMVEKINQMRSKLNEKKNKGLIDDEIYSSTLRELDNLSQGIGEKMDEIKQKLSVTEQIGQFIQDIQQYVQALGQGLQTIMSAVWSAQDTQFDNEARQLDKLNEKLQDAMDKNEEILERHKQNVDSIEDELQTARGARREHLIDQLNAEVIAERRAAAEKKKIEKEQEALKKKQDDLDKKRQQAQYQRELTQILVSGALAAINAYATKPFVPVGLAMGSLALGITAAQYAIAKANPPKFANGGLLEGKSHAQGGIKAGGVELEGNEYVVNKHTTMENLDLLEYINANRRKLNISDLIDFYSGDKPRKAIQGVRTRFADGGQIPTLRTDIDVSGGLKDAFKEYAKTPSVVQVVDIVDKTKQYNNVKVLAGLA